MLTPSIFPLKNRLAPEGRDAGWRRVSHGSTHFATEPNLHQPQDGAITPARVASITSRMHPAEPEDARLTGLTRSLYRRVMGLNVMNVTDAAVPTTPARSIVTAAKRGTRKVLSALPGEAQVA